MLRALIRTAKSPSNSTLLKPNSRASSTPLRAAKASTSKTIKGIGINWDREAMTSPSSFYITIPKPTQPSSTKIAP